MTDGFLKRLSRLGVLLLGVWLIWDLLSHLVAEILWFQEVGYLPAFLRRLQTQLGLWVVVCGTSAGFCLSNLFLANRLKYPKDIPESVQMPPSAMRRPGVGVMNSKLRVVDEARLRPIRAGTRAPSRQDSLKPTADLTLRSLLLVVLSLSLLVGMMLLYYSKIALSLWHPDLSLPNVTPPIPSSFGWTSLGQLLQLQSWRELSWELGVLVAIVVALVVKPQFWLTAIATALSLLWSLILSGQWSRVLQYFHTTAFNTVEPVFRQDISFYIFSLPVWQLLEFWLGGLFFFTLVAVTLIYLVSGDSLSQGKFPGFSQSQLRHLSGLGTGVAAIVAAHYWLHRYRLLYSTYGLVYGAGYTDITTQLPIDIGLSLLAGAIALFLLIQTIFGFRHFKTNGRTVLLVLGLYLAVVGIADGIVPLAVQRLVVQPNELVRERSYIQRSIGLTRQAFALKNIEVQTFDPKGQLTYADIQANDLTIRNIRLWDKRPLLETNRELQQIRLYYKFPDADIDRYTLKDELKVGKLEGLEGSKVGKLKVGKLEDSKVERLKVGKLEGLEDSKVGRLKVGKLEGLEDNLQPATQTNLQPSNLQPSNLQPSNLQPSNLQPSNLQPSNLQPSNLQPSNLQPSNLQPSNPQHSNLQPKIYLQQALIAARELDYNAVPQQAKTWINQHLIYTHGYGFTLSPVNTVGPGGLPDYVVKDIATGADDNSALKTSDERIRASIPIGKPRIYYGEITNNYVITSTKAKEFDYPSGDDNAYNTYDGKGGVTISSWWRRLLFAEYLKDWQIPLAQNFTPETKLLFRRNINQRIRAIAPFLRYDSDPYLVTANAGDRESNVSQNYLYWIVDAYTTSDRYPYSDPGKHEFNYIRNSVKVVIDAYHGDVDFYVADPKDPIIQTWNVIFPRLFKPLDAMPAALRSHIRYPQDLFGVQSERLLAYHMTDPQVFYNREDQWQIPQEIYGTKPRTVEPYYLIMKLPTAQSEEFILLLPFTPTQRTNLIAWLAARSDGEEYGKLLLYQFPKQVLIYGTQQIEALINQDPVISQQISLWSRQGARALQGNLLVIPIERSLLYVEPLYLEAEQNSLPTLVRVIVVYENRIVMAKTLEQALRVIFQPNQPETPAIIRPVEEPTLP